MVLASVTMADGIQWALLAQNGCIQSRDPGPASVFLRSSGPGAYTTTRTSYEGYGLLLWERHMRRLAQSMELLAIAMPDRFRGPPDIISLHELIQPSLQVGLQRALEMRRPGEEITLTILACCGQNSAPSHKTESSRWDLSVHMSNYVPKPTSVAHVAVMGPGRDLPLAKYSLWVSTRQSLENSRPLGASEIILSNDGDLLLEGSVTNFFVITAIGRTQDKKWEDIEVQTAPLEDGVLPGVLRQLVIEVCEEKGIRIIEVAPSWDSRETWKGAFLTSSLRLVQPVGSIQRPDSWDLNNSTELWKTCHWDVLAIVSCNTIQQLQELILQRAMAESLTCNDVLNPAAAWYLGLWYLKEELQIVSPTT